jgi:hypothetical protein
LATIAILLLAYIEFERSNRLHVSEVITFISNRWSSKEIIKARQIIHEIFVKKYRFDSNNYSDDFLIAVRNTSIAVYEMSRKEGEEGEKFVYLLNMLDHFENTCYLCEYHKIDYPRISKIYGNNINFYYQVFEEYINQRQKSASPDDFLNFKKVYKKIYSLKS